MKTCQSSVCSHTYKQWEPWRAHHCKETLQGEPDDRKQGQEPETNGLLNCVLSFSKPFQRQMKWQMKLKTNGHHQWCHITVWATEYLTLRKEKQRLRRQLNWENVYRSRDLVQPHRSTFLGPTVFFPLTFCPCTKMERLPSVTHTPKLWVLCVLPVGLSWNTFPPWVKDQDQSSLKY